MELARYWHRIATVLVIISYSYPIQLYAIYLYRYMDVLWQIYDWYMTDI